ncbi:MAG: SelB C-terminal domain-containing protein, partial [Chloroflexi bacterium]|nr:SelB C-terminal domain-containing protein [Chloroflexota bacterium]
LEATEPKRDIGRARLPVDRSFTIAGFGTVVTGTLIDGTFEVGQEVAVLPGDVKARIRGLQHHKEQVERATPGRRTAVNLSGVAKDDVARGQVLTLPGTLTPTIVLDVRLRAIAALRKPLRHGVELTLHTGSAEVAARLLLLDRQELAAGEEGWATLRLAAPVAAVKGDRFVLRTPNDTVAGGGIVDVHPKRHRRMHEPTLDALASLAEGSPAETLLAALAPIEPASLTEIAAAAGRSLEEAAELVQELVADGRVVTLAGRSLEEEAAAGSILISAGGFRALGARAVAEAERFHAARPLRRGVPREELRSRLQLDERLFAAALERWAADGLLVESEATVAVAGWEPALPAEQQRQADAYVQSLAAKPYAPPTDGAPEPDLLAYLEEAGQVVAVGDGIVFGADAYREMVEGITGRLRSEGTITLAQVRDMFGTSRRYAQALLEHLDRERVTRRVGDERVLRGG